MKMYKVFPDLSRQRHMKIWHKALRSQWSATDLPWDSPQRLQSDRLRDELGRLLTPVLMGEQAALYSVSGLIPVLGKTAEVESQFYLTTWAVDEARHTELFTLFYHRLGREPMSIRRFPAGYLFQSQIVSDDAAEWLAGVLVSEVTAKVLMEELRRLDLDPVLSKIADGILIDEARHLGFNHIYIEDRFADLYRRSEEEAASYSSQLRGRLERVYSFLPPTLDALASELVAIGIDRDDVLLRVLDEAGKRLDKAIDSGRRIAMAPQDAQPVMQDELELAQL